MATIFAPFLLLLLLLAFVNWVTPFQESPEAAAGINTVSGIPSPVASAPPSTREQPAATAPPVPTMPPSAIIPAETPVPTLTPFVPPLFPADARIELLGPPADSTFAIDDRVPVYWRWPFPLSVDQSFAVYASVDGHEILIGTVGEPNLGSAYSFGLSLGDIVDVPAQLRWQVRLITVLDETPLMASEVRSVSLLPVP